MRRHVMAAEKLYAHAFLLGDRKDALAQEAIELQREGLSYAKIPIRVNQKLVLVQRLRGQSINCVRPP